MCPTPVVNFLRRRSHKGSLANSIPGDGGSRSGFIAQNETPYRYAQKTVTLPLVDQDSPPSISLNEPIDIGAIVFVLLLLLGWVTYQYHLTADQFLQLVHFLAWPIVALIIGILFKEHIAHFLRRMTHVKLPGSIELDAEQQAEQVTPRRLLLQLSLRLEPLQRQLPKF